MSDDFELVHGSGNVFRDLGLPNPDLEQLRAIVAAQILGVLQDRQLTVRKAEQLTGVDAGDLSRISTGKITRFTVDRLMNILAKLDQDIEVSVTVGRRSDHHPAPAHA
jgi:predicted XRE-type DNA-binding protein